MLTTDRSPGHGRREAALLLFALLSGSPLGAQVPDGGTVQINTIPYPTSTFVSAEAVAVDRHGNSVFVWESRGSDGSGNGVFGRRFDRMGDPLGPEFQINSYTTGEQKQPKVAFDGHAGFVVVWTIPGAGGWLSGQRFDASGARIGGEFTVTQSIWGYGFPSLAVAPSGAFVVAWDAPDGSSSGIVARRYDENGSPLGSEFLVNTSTAQQEQHSRVAFTDHDGSFVVVYDVPLTNVLGQAFSADGNKIGAEFVVNSPPFGWEPAIASSGDGTFVVAWSRDGPFRPDGGGIVGRRYSVPDQPLGAEFPIRETATRYDVAPSVAVAENGAFVVSYTSSVCLPGPWGCGGEVFAKRFDASGTRRGPEFLVGPGWSGRNYPSHMASDPYGNFIVSWSDVPSVNARWYGGLLPERVDVDVSPTATSDGNGILEPGEKVSIVPSWTNSNGTNASSRLRFAGVGTFIGPPGGAYTLKDPTANYGVVAYAATGSCRDTGDCYAVALSETSPRPAPHWDATLREDIVPDAQGQSRNWLLHVGASFADVPRLDPFYRYVETALHAGVTSGCSTTSYCPDSATTREQMAVFVLVAKEGVGYRPPPCGTPMFADVRADSPFCPFVEELARRGVAGGCGEGLYCPEAAVTREQMAELVVGAVDSAKIPPACVEGAEVFADVLASSPYCAVIEELARRNIVTGCARGKYCPAASVTRAQMSVFLTVTFGLTLYSP